MTELQPQTQLPLKTKMVFKVLLKNAKPKAILPLRSACLYFRRAFDEHFMMIAFGRTWNDEELHSRHPACLKVCYLGAPNDPEQAFASMARLVARGILSSIYPGKFRMGQPGRMILRAYEQQCRWMKENFQPGKPLDDWIQDFWLATGLEGAQPTNLNEKVDFL